MPVDVDKQVVYWKAGAREDLGVAELLLEQRRTRYALFFGHLALEKALKAMVTRITRDIPPRTHDLVRLSALARLSLSSAQHEVLQDMQQYNLEGRYPSDWPTSPAADAASSDLARAKELVLWLLQQ